MGISIGLVGLGAFGSAFAELFKKHPLVDRIGLCDRMPERMEQFAKRESWRDKFNPKDTYASLDDICKSDLDALVIITQHWLHTPQAVQAMESGKHVYAAVPLITIPDGDEILDWCDRLVNTVVKTGRHYMYGETTYYHPETQYCRHRAAEGAFGDFVYAEGQYFHDFDTGGLKQVRTSRFASAGGQEWQKKLQSYWDRGVIDGPMHYPTHSTAGPISLMNAHATKVFAVPYRDTTGDEYFAHMLANETALFQMSNGAAARICEFRQIAARGRESFSLYGTNGSFENGQWRTRGGESVALSTEDMRDPLPAEVAEAWKDTSTKSVAYGGHGGSHAFLVNEFVDAIANDRMPAINAWEAVRYMAAGVIAHKSAMREGELLDVPDWGDAPA